MCVFFAAPLFVSADESVAGDSLAGTVSGSENKVSGAARWLITLSLQFMQAISGFILGLGMALVDLTLSNKLYDQVFFAPNTVTALNTGWGLVRDFVNMFFILILIFVAIATILRVNKFSDKKFIVYVVTAALFVNFSKPITMFVIDISNLAMSFFMENIREGNASYSSALLNAQGMGEAFKSDTTKANTMGMFVSWAVEIVFKFIMGIMLLALGLSLVIRLVALWVLIILSPLAFFAIALPGTAVGGIKTSWLNKLTYWCFYGPIMLFFFWLALVLVSAVSTTVAFGDAELQMAGINKNHFIVGALKVFIPYAACIYMLFYGFDLSKKMASQAGNGASWALGKAGGAGKGLAMGIGKGAAFGLTAGYGFGYGKAAYGNVKESVQKNLAAGALQKKAVMPFGNVDRKKHNSGLVDEETKKWDDKGVPSKEELKKIMDSKPSAAKTIGNVAGLSETRSQGEARRKAAAIKLAEGGNLKAADGSYGRAEAMFKNDPRNLEKFRKASEKKSRKEMIEHDFSKNKAGLIEDVVLAENSKREAPMDQSTEDSFRRVQAEKIAKQKSYNDQLQKMKLTEITDQPAEFLEQEEVKNYMKKNTGTGNETEGNRKKFNVAQIRKHAAENLDGTRQKALAEAGYFAPAAAAPATAEEEEAALRDMNS